MNRLVSFGVAAALVASGVVWAAPAKNEAEAKTAVETRSAHFKDMGKAMEPIGNMLRRKQPYDAAVAAKHSEQIVELSKKIPSLYEVDTRQFKDIKTEALDGIWTSQADFKGKADDLTRAATALNEATKAGGDQAAFTKNAAAVGKACGTCHDSYRVKKAG
jgi:cytochrome c556